jgi:4-hydroxybenzoyl-CoA reductase subunit beta
MSLPRFQYFGPKTLREALSIMQKLEGGTTIVAGGTEVMGRLKHGLIQPSCVVSLKGLQSLGGITHKKKEIVIGAGTSVAELAESAVVARLFKAVSQAANVVAAPPIRNVATVGGNILQNTRCLYYNQSAIVREGLGPCYKLGGQVCHAVKGGTRCFSVYQGDLACALIACGAKTCLRKTGSSRTVPLEALFTGNGKAPLAIESTELMTEILLPLPKEPQLSAYQKLRMRKSIDYALASAAVALTVTKKGTVGWARVVVGAAGPLPRVADEAAKLLVGKAPGDIDAGEVAAVATRGAETVDNVLLPASYRRKMVAIYVRRALQQALNDPTMVPHG